MAPTFACTGACSQVFATAKARNFHSRHCRFVCVVTNCARSFVTSHMLQRHQHWHATGQFYDCRLGCRDCWFNNNEQLTRHSLKTHGTTWQEVCQIMGVGYQWTDGIFPVPPVTEAEGTYYWLTHVARKKKNKDAWLPRQSPEKHEQIKDPHASPQEAQETIKEGRLDKFLSYPLPQSGAAPPVVAFSTRW